MKIKRYLLLILVFLNLSISGYGQDEKNAHLYGELYALEDRQHIRVKMWSDPFDFAQKRAASIDTLITVKQTSLLQGAINQRTKDFALEVDQANLPAWISFEDEAGIKRYGPYLLSKGDSIKIKIDQVESTVLFGGPSRYAFEMMHNLSQLVDRATFDQPSYLVYSSSNAFDQASATKVQDNNGQFRRKVLPVVSRVDRFAKMKSDLSVLEDEDFWTQVAFYKERTPAFVADAVMTEIISNLYIKVFYGFYGYYYRDLEEREPALKPQFEAFFKVKESEIDSYVSDFDPSFSPTYLKMQEYRMLAKSMISGKSVFEESGLEEKAALREAILTGHYLERKNILKFGIKDFGTFLQEVERPKFKKLLEPWYAASLPGIQVPEYPFLNEAGEEVSLRDFEGKIVLLNIWMTGCSACKFFNEDHFIRLKERYGEDKEVVLLALSLDRNEKIWKRSREMGTYAPDDTMHLWTGLSTNPTAHPYLSYFNISSAPQLQLIDQAGKLTGLGIADKTYEGISAEIEKLKSSNP
ncbi:TlpA family protein disulfide reductase [Belliella aquatica]|uniref:Thioredoxin domain-containing protein n=1 Tax=Belliella aquatica TaxID=1323734 RepID=A0ABQ1MYS2_9BACT|nr:thioredoxin-like domain-containing protein [Belliella aquatica]MCH7407444.1 redoxin domain-containing protein [Belliella aquatica]GGC49267.1 hypothetical protein GCM10010993_29670 [Belliella aquatica]